MYQALVCTPLRCLLCLQSKFASCQVGDVTRQYSVVSTCDATDEGTALRNTLPVHFPCTTAKADTARGMDPLQNQEHRTVLGRDCLGCFCRATRWGWAGRFAIQAWHVSLTFLSWSRCRKPDMACKCGESKSSRNACGQGLPSMGPEHERTLEGGMNRRLYSGQ